MSVATPENITFLLGLLTEEQMCAWAHHVGGCCDWEHCPTNNPDERRVVVRWSEDDETHYECADYGGTVEGAWHAAEAEIDDPLNEGKNCLAFEQVRIMGEWRDA
jgi:hypothetical protein|tara:strand:+ start:306 stop:620 length:315 start_codon:yes stop_codon:yes gene_type:complete